MMEMRRVTIRHSSYSVAYYHEAYSVLYPCYGVTTQAR